MAREHVLRLAGSLALKRAAVVGSVARGDFSVWSDVDLVVVADGLPEPLPERLGVLSADCPPRVEVIGFTPAELERARRRGNQLVRELDELGIDVLAPGGRWVRRDEATRRGR